MRITYRNQDNKEYWNKRWTDIPPDEPMDNANAYPLKYAELTIKSRTGLILEAGCGAGRILRYYKNKGYDIIGIDFIEIAVAKLKVADPELKAEVGDITKLNFRDESFRYVLAFGLYHNLEYGLEEAIKETYRVLEKGGKVCASFRADNIQTKLTDWLENHRNNKKHGKNGAREFHKLNLSRSEFISLFKKEGFTVENVYTAENMPILYKFRIFRSKSHKIFDENKARQEGYQLSWIGKISTRLLMRFFPDQFCNIYVLIAKKN